MCYRPLNTGMERMKVLTDLRQEECILPLDLVDNGKLSKTYLLRLVEFTLFLFVV